MPKPEPWFEFIYDTSIQLSNTELAIFARRNKISFIEVNKDLKFKMKFENWYFLERRKHRIKYKMRASSQQVLAISDNMIIEEKNHNDWLFHSKVKKAIPVINF